LILRTLFGTDGRYYVYLIDHPVRGEFELIVCQAFRTDFAVALYRQPHYFPEATDLALSALQPFDIMEYFEFKMGERPISLTRFNIYSVTVILIRPYD
jgi:hypothetical protein